MTNCICYRRRFLLLVALLAPVVFSTGCSPTQPFYFFEDGDLSHYVGMATNIEYPDTETCSLQEVDNPLAPLTISNPNFNDTWDLKLEDSVRIALQNGKVMRQLGVNAFSQQFNIARTQVGSLPGSLQAQPQAIPTVYDVALQESDPIFGPEGALSVYDPQVTSSMIWNKNDRPQNIPPPPLNPFQNRVFQQDLGTFQNAITKRTATGAEFAFRNNLIYENNNRPPLSRDVPSDWTVNFEAGFRQPLLQGAGSQYNRIAGPFDPLRGIGTYLQWDGIVIARIRTDIRLAEFEAGVRNFVADVENAYWELYFGYRNLEARRSGRDSALQTWKKVHALFVEEARGGEADKEAQAREQYFFFRGEVETAQADLFRLENRLRFIMGLAATDGRLIRPIDEPTDAKLLFDWCEVHAEGLVRSVELRQQKWTVKQRELELLASKNLLLPRVDALGTYRWLGLGHDLIQYPGEPFTPSSSLANTDAFSTLASGEYQEWELGVQASLPLGFRRELAAVRNQQLQLARERSILQDQELELSHQMADDIRAVDTNYQLTQSNFNRRVAAERQVEAVDAAYRAGTVTLDLLLEAQRRRADAEAAYYRTLVDYNKAIMFVHFRKGSLLEYNGVYLAEGPWPQKAYFDATRRARARDAGMYLDYGFTRPAVFSTGPFEQFQNSEGTSSHVDGEPTLAAPEELKRQPTPAVRPESQEMDLPEPAFKTGRGPMQGPRLSQMGRPMEMQAGHAAAAKPLAATKSVKPQTAADQGKVQLTSAEQPAAFDWGDLSLNKAKANAPAKQSPAPNADSKEWKSPYAGTGEAGQTSGSWKAAR
jgi:outer membrane protein TolC